MIDTINLKQRTLEWMGRQQFRSKNRGTLWPSEASANFTNQYGEPEIVGKCHRAIFYRNTGVTPTNPPTASSQIVFLLGHKIEDAITEIWKQMGIWENNSVRWEDKAKNLSGEFDLILREGTALYGAEIKSFYGYYANKQILGHSEGRGSNKRWIPGRPKDENLMQAAIYVDQTASQLAGFKLFYISRDNCDMAEHNITIGPDKTIYVNGTAETRFNLDTIYNRYTLINNKINANEKPPREFILNPSDERVNILYERGDISESAYKDHCSGKEKVRDFHCSYCEFKNHCWKVDQDV